MQGGIQRVEFFSKEFSMEETYSSRLVQSPLSSVSAVIAMTGRLSP